MYPTYIECPLPGKGVFEIKVSDINYQKTLSKTPNLRPPYSGPKAEAIKFSRTKGQLNILPDICALANQCHWAKSKVRQREFAVGLTVVGSDTTISSTNHIVNLKTVVPSHFPMPFKILYHAINPQHLMVVSEALRVLVGSIFSLKMSHHS
ncbi:hypothetical protein K438DRAFT_1749618 [Mycena galopus ATCC 62051]|nr:hypothetical protein K438DRAFT_1749618 [Mycena galopus ATCC 62051]